MFSECLVLASSVHLHLFNFDAQPAVQTNSIVSCQGVHPACTVSTKEQITACLATVFSTAHKKELSSYLRGLIYIDRASLLL